MFDNFKNLYIISLEVNFRIYSLGRSTDFLREMEVKKF